MFARRWVVVGALVAVSGCVATSGGAGSGNSQGASQSADARAAAAANGAAASTSTSPGGAAVLAASSTQVAGGVSGASVGGVGNGGGAAGDAATPRAQTSEERRAAIEHRLDDSLGTFDATLKQEQEQLAKERDTHATPGAGSAATEGNGSPPGADRAGSADQSHEPRRGPRARRGAGGDPHSGDLHSVKQDPGSNSGGSSGNGASAREVGDGSDDDIVARRLRKAAEQETDPELKEKLWHEYLEYKKNGQSK